MAEPINPGKLATETGAQYRARMVGEAERPQVAMPGDVAADPPPEAVTLLASRVVKAKRVVKGRVKPRVLAKPKKK